MYGILVILILFLCFCVMIYFCYSKYSSNESNRHKIILRPFTANLPPPNSNLNLAGAISTSPEDGMYLIQGGSDENGQFPNQTPQIICPANTTINILGAYIQVNDPYNSCTSSPNGAYTMSCGIYNSKTSKSCESSSDCDAGMICDNTSKKCVPESCTVGSIPTNNFIQMCPSEIGQSCTQNSSDGNLLCINNVYEWNPLAGTCMYCNSNTNTYAVAGLCENTNSDGSNVVCLNQDVYIRDVSGYMSKACDGKISCMASGDEIWKPNDPTTIAGPLPCPIPAKSSDPNYSRLPIVPGWNGSTPSSGSSASPGTFSQGYSLHGLYTCIPK